MALSVDDVKKIVDSKIGGMTLTPAPTTFIEGRMVTPQIPTLCSASSQFDAMKSDAGKALGEMKDAFGNAVNSATGAFDNIKSEISGAIGAAVAGTNQYLINPIQSACNDAISGINASVSGLTTQIAAATAAGNTALATALTAAKNELAAAQTTVNNALAQGAALVGEKFEQVLGAMNMCKPEQMPGITQYAPTDFTKTLDQMANIDAIRLKAASITSAANTLVATQNTANYAALDTLKTATNGLSTTVTSAVNSDIANLAGAQAQNDAMSKFMTMANGLNSDNTKSFIMQCTNPASQALVGKAAVGLANASKAMAAEE